MEQGSGGRADRGDSPIQREAGSRIRLGAPHSRIGGAIRILPAYIRRTFAARYGCSPKEYLDQLRNEHAVRRILHTGDSITDIARACGYQDVYQFSKAFKKRNSLSPTEYRRERGRRVGESTISKV
ncbi:helix-turn-helix transcriptional regulator [Paenibacillus sp. P26]|nr:helix-turn-helix transcriptional regulator [Paenibacillus sp. P26]UUZ93394.1 helix-turn-helix transcriptional regulator [Paenibacillus sp. P25]